MGNPGTIFTAPNSPSLNKNFQDEQDRKDNVQGEKDYFAFYTHHSLKNLLIETISYHLLCCKSLKTNKFTANLRLASDINLSLSRGFLNYDEYIDSTHGTICAQATSLSCAR